MSANVYILQVERPTSNQFFLHILPLFGKLSKNEHMLLKYQFVLLKSSEGEVV